MKTAAEFLKEYCNLKEETSEIEVNPNDVIRAMIDYAHQQNDNMSQIMPTDLRIKERSEEEYIITDEDFESEHGGEFDDYVVRKNRSRKAFCNGAVWMRKMLIGK